jgi:hypothetical protein
VSSSPLTGFARDEPMPDSDFLEGYGMPLAVGEAYWRVRIPWPDCPTALPLTPCPSRMRRGRPAFQSIARNASTPKRPT